MKKHSPKAPPPQSPPLRSLSPVAALVCALCLGGLCMYFASSYLASAGTPALFVNFARKPDGAMPLHFFNAGEGEIVLDVAGMQRFLFYPASGGSKYILQLRSVPFGPDAAENTRRRAAMKTLAPQEAFEIGDMRPVIAALPNATSALVAAYAGAEEVRSLPLILREEK